MSPMRRDAHLPAMWVASEVADKLEADLRTNGFTNLADELHKAIEKANPPEPRCSRCGVPESDSPYGHLSDVRVLVCDGEEGYSDVTMMLCDGPDCLGLMIDGVKKMGFVHHHHGSTDLLADEDCPGDKAGVCLTPHDYGPVTVPGHGWDHATPDELRIATAQTE